MTEETNNISESENNNQDSPDTTSVSKGSFFPKFIAFTAFIFSVASLIVIFTYSKNLNRRISSLDSVIWALDRKIDNEIGHVSGDIDALKGQYSTMENSIIIAELKQVLVTINRIKNDSGSQDQKDRAKRLTGNINELISDLEYRPSSARSQRGVKPAFGDIHIEKE